MREKEVFIASWVSYPLRFLSPGVHSGYLLSRGKCAKIRVRMTIGRCTIRTCIQTVRMAVCFFTATVYYASRQAYAAILRKFLNNTHWNSKHRKYVASLYKHIMGILQSAITLILKCESKFFQVKSLVLACAHVKKIISPSTTKSPWITLDFFLVLVW